MFRIKRTKAVGEKEDRRVAVHYATAVTARGSIGGWDASPANAAAVTPATAERVAAFHKGRANVGALDFEPVKVGAEELAKAEAADADIAADEFRKLRAEVRRLSAKNAELAKAAAESGRAAGEAAGREKAAAQEAKALKDRVADLEQQLAKAEEAATAPPKA